MFPLQGQTLRIPEVHGVCIPFQRSERGEALGRPHCFVLDLGPLGCPRFSGLGWTSTDRRQCWEQGSLLASLEPSLASRMSQIEHRVTITPYHSPFPRSSGFAGSIQGLSGGKDFPLFLLGGFKVWKQQDCWESCGWAEGQG